MLLSEPSEVSVYRAGELRSVTASEHGGGRHRAFGSISCNTIQGRPPEFTSDLLTVRTYCSTRGMHNT